MPIYCKVMWSLKTDKFFLKKGIPVKSEDHYTTEVNTLNLLKQKGMYNLKTEDKM